MSVDISAPVTTFKKSIYEATGVPVGMSQVETSRPDRPERMKVMIKGILRDDADMSKLGLKPVG